MLVIYHGSYLKIEKPRILKDKLTKDFGSGFYCMIIESQADKWSKRYKTPIVNMYEYKEDKSLECIKFIGVKNV